MKKRPPHGPRGKLSSLWLIPFACGVLFVVWPQQHATIRRPQPEKTSLPAVVRVQEPSSPPPRPTRQPHPRSTYTDRTAR